MITENFYYSELNILGSSYIPMIYQFLFLPILLLVFCICIALDIAFAPIEIIILIKQYKGSE